MSWLWGQSSKPPESSRETKSSSDPLRKLDPELREFLKNEAPEKYDSSNPPASSSPPPISTPKDPISYREKLLGTDSAQTEVKRSQTDTDPSKPPPQSLYQDGRYAHIWKNYRPLQDVENAGKSDQERLLDVLEGFKSRKAEIGRAALENCTMEQIAVSDCFSSGSWKSRMTMCRTENKKLERCYLMQARFLKALGYLSTNDRPEEMDEKIQMHADKLYQQMMVQEKAVKDAKAANLPPPTFGPLIGSSRPSDDPLTFKVKLGNLRPDVKAQLRQRFEGLTSEERIIEERAILAELEVGEKVSGKVEQIRGEEQAHRKERRETGQPTFGDRVAGLFGW